MILATLDTIITVPNILFTLTLLGVLFSVYLNLKKPTEDIEHKQIVSEEILGTKATILAQQTMEGKAALLATQVEWEKIANEKKFTEFGVRLDASMLLASNHIHTVDIKIDKLIEVVNNMNIETTNQITKLTCIIEERIPKKNN
jgi:hypothetical protein